jgi:NADH-quinone oxidoreductase subunit C
MQSHFGGEHRCVTEGDCVTIELPPEHLLAVCHTLRDDFQFEQLMDVCGVDYQDYGVSHWRTHAATDSGFSRGVDIAGEQVIAWNKPRFASVYHLLSITHNQRIRLKVYLGQEPVVPSVIDIWQSADWFEREAYDLLGIVYEGHPDLRRLLTDYGFKGHPFRKDFPLVGEVEMRYDATLQRCVYEPVSIEDRTLVPKVIRRDNRYIT